MLGYEFYRQKQDKLLIGLMCGTSADGVDVALAKISGFGFDSQVELLDYLEYPLPDLLREEIFKSFDIASSDVWQISQLNFALGDIFAQATLTMLKKAKLKPEAITAIGSHGQTVHHIPNQTAFAQGRFNSTLQLGSAAVIAELAQINVVSDFRSRDMAVQGQGAPLVPYVDLLLFRKKDKTRILQNIGGIANFTLLPAGQVEYNEILACDSGPGNMIMDAIANQTLGLAYDPEGQEAAKGKIDQDLLKSLLADEYFDLTPPKSTGRERYGLAYAQKLIELASEKGLKPQDMLATANELTARTIVKHYEDWVFPNYKVDEIIVSGGGLHNKTLTNRLKELCPEALTWLNLEDLNILPDAKEALAFAILANETLCYSPNNLPAATGATKPVVLGSITYK